MKILTMVFIALAAGASPLWAQQAGELGAGIIAGNPTGVTGKYWLSSGRALDAGVGIGADVTLYGDHLWHSLTVLPQPARGRLPAYLGLGLQLGDGSSNGTGLRAVVGAAYWYPGKPLEIFFELVPVLRFSSGDSASLGAGLGVRYYFDRS